MDATVRVPEAVPETEIERLRRRLYVPDASDRDVVAYRDAVSTRPAPAPSVPVAGRRRVRFGRGAGVLALAAGVLVLGAAAALLGPRVGAVSPSAAGTAAPPIEVRSSSYALTASNRIERTIDVLFFSGSNAAAANAFGSLGAIARRVALPGASDGSVLDATADDGQGSVVVDDADRPLVVRRGSLLLLTVFAERPTVAVWRIFGYRAGEPQHPHLIVIARPAGEVDRLLVAAMRAPADLSITTIRVDTSPTSAVFTRLEVHRASACTRETSARCPLGG